MVHSWVREAQPEEGFLQIDFSNAFNCISRSSLLQQVSLHAPAFFPYSLFSYSTPTPLFGTGFTLSSHSSGGGRRPADLLIEALESEPLAADIGLVHPPPCF